jgi:drug/metabolite transporter (DMT)-like permease
MGQTLVPAAWRPRARPLAVAGAFAALYFVWGSTYPALRVAVRAWPPLLLAGSRFAVAGALLYLLARARGAPALDATGWWRSAAVGAGLIAAGNGGVTWATRWVPGGLAAVVLAVVPLCVVLLEWGLGRGRPAARQLGGAVAGLAGIALLAAPGSDLARAPASALAALALAAVGHALAAVRARVAPAGTPLMTAAGASLTGGAMLLVGSVALGEPARLEPAMLGPAALASVGYLVVVGSVVALSAYAWLLEVSTPARVATYTFVNPVVALVLGWALLGEILTARSALASALVVVAVAATITSGRAAAVERPPSVRALEGRAR